MTENTDQLGEVIDFLDTDTISADELARAMTLVGSMPVEDILKLRPIDFAKHIIQVQKDAPQDASSLTKREDLTPAQCSKIAKQLIESLSDMYRSTNNVLQDATLDNGLPRDVRVTLNKSIDQMTLKELLELLAGDATQYDDVLPYIRRSEPYRQAHRRTVNCVIPTATGTGLDPKATLDYIVHLNTQGTHIQRKLQDGRRPTTIERAFKHDDRPLVNVFTQEPTNGPDAYGRDWGNLSADFHEALVWACKTQHAGWPTGGDFFALTGEIMEQKLNPRWQGILDDYLEAKADDDPTTVGISRYYNARHTSRSTSPSYQEQPPTPVMTEDDYRRALYDIAEDYAHVRSSSLSKSNMVIRGFGVNSGSASLYNVIVLENSHVNSGSLDGSIFKHARTTITVGSGTNGARVLSRNWQQLYAEAQRMGLIPS